VINAVQRFSKLCVVRNEPKKRYRLLTDTALSTAVESFCRGWKVASSDHVRFRRNRILLNLFRFDVLGFIIMRQDLPAIPRA
jgi:hypothetical protein